MRRRSSWLLLVSTLVVGALACQGGSKDTGTDFDPIGDYPNTGGGGEGPISDFPRGAGGGQSEEGEQDPPPDQSGAARGPEAGDSEQTPPDNAMSPPFEADADAGAGNAEVDAAQSEADAGETAEPSAALDAGVAVP